MPNKERQRQNTQRVSLICENLRNLRFKKVVRDYSSQVSQRSE